MRITDYERGNTLRDVSISLTRQEAEDLAAYLHRLLSEPAVNRAYLSEVVNTSIDKEITIAVDARNRTAPL
jgi:hypothetical protein